MIVLKMIQNTEQNIEQNTSETPRNESVSNNIFKIICWKWAWWNLMYHLKLLNRANNCIMNNSKSWEVSLWIMIKKILLNSILLKSDTCLIHHLSAKWRFLYCYLSLVNILLHVILLRKCICLTLKSFRLILKGKWE